MKTSDALGRRRSSVSGSAVYGRPDHAIKSMRISRHPKSSPNSPKAMKIRSRSRMMRMSRSISNTSNAFDWKNAVGLVERMETIPEGTEDRQSLNQPVLIRYLKQLKSNERVDTTATRTDIIKECIDDLNDLLENIEEWSEQEVNSTLQTTLEKLEGAKVCSEHQKKEYEMLKAYAAQDAIERPASPLHSRFDSFSQSRYDNHSICSHTSNASEHIGHRLNNFQSLSRLGHWDFDIFQLDSESHGHCLSAMMSCIFQVHQEIGEVLGVTQTEWDCFFRRIEKDYGDPEIVPYHNRIHAAQTTATTLWFLKSKTLSKIEILDEIALLFAAAVHDVGHLGRTNEFLKVTEHEYAIRYNDIGIMENYHISHTFRIMHERPEYNILKNCSLEEKYYLRDKLITLVLGTDMSHHNEMCEAMGKNWGARDYDHNQLHKNVLHAADVGTPTLEWTNSEKMAQLITREFHMEGDALKELGIEVAALKDRDAKYSIAESQIAFINFAVLPLYKLLRFWIPECAGPLKILNHNLKKWKEMLKNAEHEDQSDPAREDLFKVDSASSLSTTGETADTTLQLPFCPFEKQVFSRPTSPIYDSDSDQQSSEDRSSFDSSENATKDGPQVSFREPICSRQLQEFQKSQSNSPKQSLERLIAQPTVEL